MNRHRNKRNGNTRSLGIRLLEFFAPLIVPKRVREEFVGDLLEECSSSVVPQRGKLKGFFWLCSQLLRSTIPMAQVRLRHLFFGGYGMFKSHIPTSVKMAAAAVDHRMTMFGAASSKRH